MRFYCRRVACGARNTAPAHVMCACVLPSVPHARARALSGKYVRRLARPAIGTLRARTHVVLAPGSVYFRTCIFTLASWPWARFAL